MICKRRIEMIDLEAVSEKYFNGVKTKHLKKIEYTTVGGNNVKALINKASNRHMGSLYIYEVNGEATEQFVRSMPKIHYWDNHHKLDCTKGAVGYVKYDGSCVIVYALRDAKGEIIEVVPKSRNMPTLDPNLQAMYDDCETLGIRNYVMNTGNTLFFELHGIRNKHMITEMETYCELTIIGEVVYKNGYYIDGELQHHYPIRDEDFDIGWHYPSDLFRLREFNGKTYINDIEYHLLYKNYMTEDLSHNEYDTPYDALMAIKKELDNLNEKYKAENGRIAIEGLVFNGYNLDGEQMYIKLKPTMIENDARSENGIPKTAIRKECYKFIDEYGSQVKDIYLNNPQMIWDYINHMLLEEYEQLWVDKSQKKIKDTFCSVMNAKEVPESIQNICQKLINDYPQEDVKGLIRIFAQEYPFMKKEAHTVYNQLSMIKERQDG